MKKFSEMSKEEMEKVMSGVNAGNKGGGRKEEVLSKLKEGIWSVKELGNEFGISSRNVSSIICYLRDDGYVIKKVGNGGLVLWGKIGGGEKDSNRIVLGKKGKEVRYNFEKIKFDDE